jgi:Fe-S-cluster containining protein
MVNLPVNKNSSLLPATALMRPYFHAMQRLLERWPEHPESYLMLTGAESSRFSCSGCGACCRKSWRIPVSQTYYDQWYTHFHEHPSGRFSQPFVRFDNPGGKMFADIQRQADGISCIFLQPDQRCFIHEHYGAEALPDVCQIYPRQEIRLSPYHGAQLMRGTCEDILPIWLEDETLYARFVPHPFPTSARPEIAVRRSVCSMLAICLDVMVQPVNTPLQRFGSLTYLLERLRDQQADTLNQSELNSLYREQLRLSCEQIWSGPTHAEVRETSHFLRLFVPHQEEKLQGFLPWLQTQPDHRPALAETEQLQLAHVLQAFLIRQLLKVSYDAQQVSPPLLFASFFFNAIRAVLLQLFAIFKARCAQTTVANAHIQWGLGILDQYFPDDQRLSNYLDLEQFSTAQILAWIPRVLSLDCGHQLPVQPD